jgi:branched-chain amino acid transport system ATP-binding protein
VSLLVVRGLRVVYGATIAVDDVDVTAYRGEILALIGPNGAGKSTFLDAVAGVAPVEAGQVMLDGLELEGPPHRRSRAGLARTFQTPALIGPTPIDEVALASTPGRGVVRGLFNGPGRAGAAAAADLLERVELAPELWRARVRDLGLTDRRRVELARALACGPRLLLLDEPAAGLPAPDRARFAALVASLAGPDLGIVLVEHDMALVSAVAHVVVALDQGRVVAIGSYAEVAGHPVVRSSYLGEVVDA